VTRPRIAILGGGIAGLTTACELSRPGWRDRFESITVYQLGWRLGGKGASGRGENGRIEEHGLHIWFGFYDNAFRMLRECYEELGRPHDSPLATIEKAFEPAHLFKVQEWREREDRWLTWPAPFEAAPGRPGDATPLPSMWECLVRSLRLSREFLHSIEQRGASPSPPRARGAAARGDLAGTVITRLLELLQRLRGVATTAEITAGAALGEALTFASSLHADPNLHAQDDHVQLHGLVERAMAVIRKRLPDCDALPDEARRAWYLADILLACVRGVLQHRVLFSPGLEAIDEYEFSEWLTRHGASPESVACTLITTTVYNLAFAYEDGDPDKRRASAATALRGLARLFFTYKGAIAWRMRAGMGDVVFAPIYQALVNRGVDFQFFHRVEELHLSPDRSRIDSIDVGIQVLPKTEPYRPLVDVKGLACWPSRPPAEFVGDATAEELESFWSERPDEGRRTLRYGHDFDEAVLAIPVGAHPFICRELIDDSPAWKRMVEGLPTIYTQSFQLWLSKSLEDLGCGQGQAVSGGYLEPFDTYADMRQLVAAEDWRHDHVRGIAYFCSAMRTPPGVPDRTDRREPARAREEVRANALQFLRDHMQPLWPDAVEHYPTDFRWDLLIGDGEGPERFDSQFCRANVDPSERYVLSLPGTAQYRLHPGASGYTNLTCAGDWTACSLNAGCIEAAVISGMLAARVIDPSIEDRIVDWKELGGPPP
jgi:uncharacterized protein with NAD-binding domain and iron-sulfur cluster